MDSIAQDQRALIPRRGWDRLGCVARRCRGTVSGDYRGVFCHGSGRSGQRGRTRPDHVCQLIQCLLSVQSFD